jgi:hypothetical protein
MVNFLALLGWNEGDGSEREMYSLEELQVGLLLSSDKHLIAVGMLSAAQRRIPGTFS